MYIEMQSFGSWHFMYNFVELANVRKDYHYKNRLEIVDKETCWAGPISFLELRSQVIAGIIEPWPQCHYLSAICTLFAHYLFTMWQLFVEKISHD